MIRGIILDLDGTVYRGSEQVPGAASFIEFARSHGIRCVFVTNRANRIPAEVAGQLQRYGIECREADVITSAQVVTRVVQPCSVYCIGEEGLIATLTAAGFTMTENHADYVISSFDRCFSYEKLKKAARLIRAGAKFIATNLDACINFDDGLWPGAGSIAAAVEMASGTKPIVMGKPEPLIMEISIEKMKLSASEVINVGDNLSTDIAAGIRSGIRSVLILTGVSSCDDLASSQYKPTWVVHNYTELATIICSENSLTR